MLPLCLKTKDITDAAPAENTHKAHDLCSLEGGILPLLFTQCSLFKQRIRTGTHHHSGTLLLRLKIKTPLAYLKQRILTRTQAVALVSEDTDITHLPQAQNSNMDTRFAVQKQGRFHSF